MYERREPKSSLPEALSATLKGHAGGIRICAFSPDCKRVVTASTDKMAWLWDAAL
ncbi:hypothetical protein M885DRAFT_578546 [Pelagophyceae sp. CCMP2097]|nr:hypothetical protein M885DRAFT_578546 [Pelagophyceae sp. CCMP2097]